MLTWNLAIPLDASRELPQFAQLADGIAEAIRTGRLAPGAALPGTRAVAAALGVNRNTVVAAYDELVAQGLVAARGGAGSFVAAVPRSPRPPAMPIGIPTYALPPSKVAAPFAPPSSAGKLALHAGLPDARLFPARELARAFRRAIVRRRLDHADPRGHPALRRELASMLAQTRALAVTPHTLMTTRSVEQAIDLVARCLVAPGDVVAVEALGYPPAWRLFALAGARLAPLPVDAEGLDVDALEAQLAHGPVRAVFLTPHHQFPTTAVMSPARRARLAQLALTHRFAIVEDDYDHEFHYDGRPVLPIAAGAGGANTIYIGSLANLLAPGVATAFVTAPAPVFERLAWLRAASDARGDLALEAAVAELYDDGALMRHVRRARGIYATRRDALVAALRRRVGSALAVRVPAGGLALWARAADDIDVAAWERNAYAQGVVFHNAQPFDFQGRAQRYLRLGFGCHDAAELDEAARRMAAALPRAFSVPVGMVSPLSRAVAASA